MAGTTSSPQTVTLSNRGQAPLMMGVTSVNGAFGFGTVTCPPNGSKLAAGRSCTVGITFQPVANGATSGTLSFFDNASNSPQNVPLTGTGILPATVSPSSLAFGKQAVDTVSPRRTVILTNQENQTLRVTSITTSAGYRETNQCLGGLAAHSNCFINVTFAPTSAGPYPGTLTINYSGFGSPLTVSLSGTGG